MSTIEWILIFILLGTLVGFIAGLLGAGGGGILVPILAFIFSRQGVSADKVIHFALGTALACMIISSIASLRAHASRGAVVWKVVYGMTPGILLGAFFTSHLATKLNSIYIAVFFSGFMALIALQLFLNWKPKVSVAPIKLRGLFFAGTGIGSVSALAAVGSGFLMVTYLSYKNFDLKKAIGTSAAIGFPIAIGGTVGYMINGWSMTENTPNTLGFVYVPAFVAISVASVIAAPLGAALAQKLPDIYLKKILAIISLLLSVKMLWSVV